MFLIVGLGNPTLRYDKTRHNVGFDVIDVLAKRHHIRTGRRQCRALTGSGMIGSQKVILAKPLTYMNNSGESIAPLLDYYDLDAATQMIVIYDDISIDPGMIRVRQKGSAGGHNGMKSLIARCGTQEFARVRIGIGEKPPEMELAAYVLSRFSRQERRMLEAAYEDAADAVELILNGRIGDAMNRYNHKKETPKEES